MICLGIESSCDDTSLAFYGEDGLLGQVSASQVGLHALFGGVVPELASREHHRIIGEIYDQLLLRSGVTTKDITVISVARGPGLLGSLLVGVSFAKALAFGLQIPIIGVNHLHAHLLAYGIEQPLKFPALGLLVSGGHTHLYSMCSETNMLQIGTSLDDAAGEAFDKAGKMLGLPYPAGIYMDTLSAQGQADKRLFPRPYLDNDTSDFSFSGLKTAMSTYLRHESLPQVPFDIEAGQPSWEGYNALPQLCDLCASYSTAVVDTLLYKTRKALAKQENIEALVLAGGVAANSLLRSGMRQLADEHAIPLLVPSQQLCTDNGAMIAHAGYLLAKKGFYHKYSFTTVPRGQRVPQDWSKKQEIFL